jgi:hypothetical protein
LAIPFIILSEIGIWIAFFFGKSKMAEGEGGASEPAASS